MTVGALEVYPDPSGETELGVLRFTNVSSGFSLNDLQISYEDITEYEDAIQSSGGFSPKTSVPQAVTRLNGNRPNPFNPMTTIRYSLAREGHARLAIYDVAGRLVRTLVSTMQGAGEHTEVWDGRDEAGRAVGSGIYLYQLSSQQYREAKKMVLIR